MLRLVPEAAAGRGPAGNLPMANCGEAPPVSKLLGHVLQDRSDQKVPARARTG